MCEVVARDGTVRDCLDDVVFCDASDENRTNYDACMVCEGGLVDYFVAWAATHGLDPTQTVIDEYDICRDVELPIRPETCSPHLAGSPPEDLERVIDMYSGFDDGTVRCVWSEALYEVYGVPQLPARLTSEDDLADHLYCYEPADPYVQVPAPPEALAVFDFGSHDLYLRDGYGRPLVGLYDDGLVVDTGCGGTSPLPPSVQLELYRLDKATPAFDEVGCQLSDCPAEVRGAPIPE